jgi:hypothetical protein
MRQNEHMVQLVARLLHPKLRDRLDAMGVVLEHQSGTVVLVLVMRFGGAGAGDVLWQCEAAFFPQQLEEQRHRNLGCQRHPQILDQRVAASFLR